MVENIWRFPFRHGGTPKSSIFVRNFPIQLLGTPIFRKPPYGFLSVTGHNSGVESHSSEATQVLGESHWSPSLWDWTPANRINLHCCWLFDVELYLIWAWGGRRDALVPVRPYVQGHGPCRFRSRLREGRKNSRGQRRSGSSCDRDHCEHPRVISLRIRVLHLQSSVVRVPEARTRDLPLVSACVLPRPSSSTREGAQVRSGARLFHRRDPVCRRHPHEFHCASQTDPIK